MIHISSDSRIYVFRMGKLMYDIIYKYENSNRNGW